MLHDGEDLGEGVEGSAVEDEEVVFCCLGGEDAFRGGGGGVFC